MAIRRSLPIGIVFAISVSSVSEVQAQAVNQCASDDQENCFRWIDSANMSPFSIAVGDFLVCMERTSVDLFGFNEVICYMPRGVSGIRNQDLGGTDEYRPAIHSYGQFLDFGVVDMAILHHYALYVLDSGDRVHSIVANPLVFTPDTMWSSPIWHGTDGLGSAIIDAVFPPIEPVDVCTGAPIDVADIEVLQPPFAGQSLYGVDASGNFLIARKGEGCSPPNQNYGWEAVAPSTLFSLFEPVASLDEVDEVGRRSITAGPAYGYFYSEAGNGAACPSYVHMGLSYDHFFLPPLEGCVRPDNIGGQFVIMPLQADDIIEPPYSPRIDWFNRWTGQWVPNINGGTVSTPDTFYINAADGYRFRQSATHVEVFVSEQNASQVIYVHRIASSSFSIENGNFQNDDPAGPAPVPNPYSSEGAISIELPTGYTSLSTRAFATGAVGAVSNELSIDVLVPSNQVNPYYVGDLQLFLTNYENELYNVPLGSASLTSLGRDMWETVTFNVPPDIQQMLLGDFSGTKLTITGVSTSEVEPVLIDNLRFSGQLTPRTKFHVEGSANADVVSSPLLSFENENDWFSTNTFVTVDPGRAIDGTNSLVVEGNGWSSVMSRSFDTSELPAATDTLSLDVFVPYDQPGDPYWIGDVQLYLTCSSANLYNAWIGQASLSYPFEGEFNDMQFPIASNIQQILAGDHQGCSITIALNVGQNAGMFRFDRLGFLLDPMEAVVPR